MNTITLLVNGRPVTSTQEDLVLKVRTRPYEFVLNEHLTELTIHTPLSQEMIMGEVLSGGYAVGGSIEGIILRPLALAAGYALGGEVDGFVTHYMGLNTGYVVGGAVNPVMLDYADGFSAGYGVGGDCAMILTRYRYMTEVDPMHMADMDTMMLSDIEFITLE